MRQNQSRVDSKRAEHLFCLDVVEVIETTLERLTILKETERRVLYTRKSRNSNTVKY